MSTDGSRWLLGRVFGALAGVAGAVALFMVWQGDQAQPISAAQPAAGQQASLAGVARSKEQAIKDLMALPELKTWSQRLEQESGGTVRGAVIEYDPNPKFVGDKSYWQLSFVESGPTVAQNWENFLVATHGSEILIEDFATEHTMSLDDWRRHRNPMARTSAESSGR